MLIPLAFYCQFNFFSRSTRDLRSLRYFGFLFFGLGVEQGFLWGRFLLSWCSKYSHAGINFLSFPYMTVRLLQPPLPLDITLPGIW